MNEEKIKYSNPVYQEHKLKRERRKLNIMFLKSLMITISRSISDFKKTEGETEEQADDRFTKLMVRLREIELKLTEEKGNKHFSSHYKFIPNVNVGRRKRR